MTDFRSKLIRRLLLAASISAAGIGLAWTARNRRLFTVSDVTTGESFDYPELRAHVYFASAADAFKAAKQAIESLPDFRLVLIDEDKKAIVAEAETSIGKFLDDVEVKSLALGPRHARVVVRSRSRVGKGDLGENARHIRAIQDAMDRILTGG